MKKALVTGSSSGIGKAFVERLRELGYYVVGMSRSEGRDVRSLDSWEEVKRLGRYDLMVLNAGVADWNEAPGRMERDILDTNVLGVYYGLYFCPELLQERGTVVVVSSVSAHLPETDIPLYGASKAAVNYLGWVFSIKYRSKYRVLVISPGYVSPTRLGGVPEEEAEEFVRGLEIPSGKVLTPLEFVDQVLKLLQCTYLWGVEVVLDGGWRCCKLGGEL